VGVLIVPFDLTDVQQYVAVVMQEIEPQQKPGIEGYTYAEAKEESIESRPDETVGRVATETTSAATE